MISRRFLAIAFLIGGIGIGFLIGLGVSPISRPTQTAPIADQPRAVRNLAASESATARSRDEQNKIILGNITTVPFQELYSLLSARSHEELLGIVQQLKDLPSNPETNTKIGIFFKAWAHFDAKAAFASAASFSSTEAKNAAIGAVIDGADSITASSLAASIADLPPDALSSNQKANFLNKILTKWSQLDPVAAAKFVDASPNDGPGLTRARIAIAKNWAASDPQAALEWAQAHGTSAAKDVAVSGVVLGWWHSDPRTAETYVRSHLDTLGPEAAMTLTREIFGQDAERAKSWVNQLPSVDARREATSFVAMQLAAIDPKSAGEWVATLPDEVREKAMSGVVGSWARNDPESAAKWINSLGGAPRDDALTAYSSAVSVKDPAAALTWATGISDGQIRDASIQRIIVRWLNGNPNEAVAWIQNSTLSAAEKARLLALQPGK